MALINQRHCNRIALRLNNRPRKRLGFLTPKECYERPCCTSKLILRGVASIMLSQFLSGLLFEIEPTDPVTFLAVGAVLAAVALLAAFVPARRATRVDPIDALRAE